MKISTARWALLALTSFGTSAALAAQAYPADPGTMLVTSLNPRNAGFSITAGADGFYFRTDTTFSVTCTPPAAAINTNTFGVPTTINGQPNPAYRDHVNALMLAHALQLPIMVYVEGCFIAEPWNILRVVGMDVRQ